jgi:simple sugar transport system ATP-binding protein
MLGHPPLSGAVRPAEVAGASPSGRPVLAARGFRAHPDRPGVDLDVHAGEILGLFGLVGAGKTSLLEGLFGARSSPAGLVLDGRPYRPAAPADAIVAGVHLVPEDRGRHGVLAAWSISRNLSLPFLGALGRFGFLDRGSERRLAEQAIVRLGIVAAGPEAAVATLSGGNQQKVVVGRWLVPGTRVLLLDEPFAGIDLGARADIGALLRATAADRATIVASADIDELLEVADRIVVLRDGGIAHDGLARATDRERYVALAAGEHQTAA